MNHNEEIGTIDNSLLSAILYELHELKKLQFTDHHVIGGLVGLKLLKLVELDGKNATKDEMRKEATTLAALAIMLLEQLE